MVLLEGQILGGVNKEVFYGGSCVSAVDTHGSASDCWASALSSLAEVSHTSRKTDTGSENSSPDFIVSLVLEGFPHKRQEGSRRHS